MSLAEELKVVLEKARRAINSAELLRSSGDNDSAVSRLYYSMFYCATALLMTKALGFSKHKAVISAFARHFVKTNLFPKEFHHALQDAFEKRKISDYQYLSPPADEIVHDLKRKAEQFLAKTEEFLKREGHV